MLVLYSSNPDQIPRLRSTLPPERQVVAVKDWDHLKRAVPAAECSVIHVDQLGSSHVLTRLSALRARFPHHPLVLVTRGDDKDVHYLKEIDVEEVVWLGGIERDLRPAVERACAHDFDYVHCLAVPFQDAEHLPAALREALAYACRSRQPVHSINQLAAATGITRGTLWYQWKKAAGEASPLRLQDLLHWLLLLRVVGRKASHRTWAEAGEEVGVHAHTLWRHGKQLTGRTLPELAADPDVVVALFRERVLELLLPEARPNIL